MRPSNKRRSRYRSRPGQRPKANTGTVNCSPAPSRMPSRPIRIGMKPWNLAIQAMQKATQLQPEYPEAWFALINYYLILDKENDAQKVMRDAQLVLSGDNLTIVSGPQLRSAPPLVRRRNDVSRSLRNQPDRFTTRSGQLGRLLSGPSVSASRPGGKGHATHQPAS